MKYARLFNDLRTHLGQHHNHCVTTLLDFYALKGEWPGYDAAKSKRPPLEKHQEIASKVHETVNEKLDALGSCRRFLPYFVMHEIEALYFSDPAILAAKIGVNPAKIEAILSECGEPEAINHERETSPSHRIENLGGSFRKTSTGIAIAAEIGLSKMREKCPLFDQWLRQIESLASTA